MKIAFFNHPRVRQFLTLLFLSGAIASIFPPATPFFHWWVDRSVGVALCYAALAFFFLLLNNSRLMFVCLGCGAVISFHFSDQMTRNLQQREKSSPPRQWQIPYRVPVPGELLNYTLYYVPAPPR